jgi:hypothetical protein
MSSVSVLVTTIINFFKLCCGGWDPILISFDVHERGLFRGVVWLLGALYAYLVLLPPILPAYVLFCRSLWAFSDLPTPPQNPGKNRPNACFARVVLHIWVESRSISRRQSIKACLPAYFSRTAHIGPRLPLNPLRAVGKERDVPVDQRQNRVSYQKYSETLGHLSYLLVTYAPLCPRNKSQK